VREAARDSELVVKTTGERERPTGEMICPFGD
jgi:hypothetical protein